MEHQVIVQSKPNKAFFRQLDPKQNVMYKEGDSRDENNYKPDGAFKGDVFLGTFKPLTPTFNLSTNKWSFAGDKNTLKELVKKCGLRYERGLKKGQVIAPEDVDWNNKVDDFFDHTEMFVRLENGKAKLNLDNPKDKFLYLCLSDDPDITNAKVTNPYMAINQKFELIDINEDKVKESDGLDNRIDAYTLFKGIKNNYDRCITVGRALGIIKEEKPEDPTALILELEKRYVSNVAPYPNSNKTYQELFIETANKDTESLNRMWLVHYGTYKSVLRPRTTGDWTMKQKDGSIKELVGVRGYFDAYTYFDNEKNFPDLDNLMHTTNAFNTSG